MVRKFIVGLFLFSAAAAVPADDRKVQNPIPVLIQDVSYTVHAGKSQGSCVICTRGDCHYVLTAAHVVADLRHVREVVDPKTGASRTKIEFTDASVVKEVYQDGRSVGKIYLDCEMLRYSDCDNGEDLALLRVRKHDIIKASTKFYMHEDPLPVGTDLLHCGSLKGQSGSNSVTSGIVSQIGRVEEGIVFDQSSCGAHRGSSGGGLFLRDDGRYIGMVVRGGGENFNLFVPMRRILSWSRRVGAEFVVNHTIPVPDDKELKKIPIEEVAGEDPKAERAAARPIPPKNVKLPFLIHKDGD